MKYRSFMLLLVAVVFLAGCGTKEATEDAKKADEVVNQQVEDYTELSEQELEVMAYDGDVDAQIELANRYDYGTAEAGRDFEKAKQWYELAASSGSGEAMCALGYFHLNGLATDVDMEQAASYFQQAIDVGNDHGYVGLGRTYLAGYGEEETRGEQAYLNIKTAYDKELPGGIYYLAYLTELGIGTEENDQEAMTLYRQVTELEELSLYDLLFDENLSKEDIKKIKKVAVDLLAKIKAKISELDHWTDKQETKAEVDTLIGKILWEELPESYSDSAIFTYRQKIYEYVYMRYKEVA